MKNKILVIFYPWMMYSNHKIQLKTFIQLQPVCLPLSKESSFLPNRCWYRDLFNQVLHNLHLHLKMFQNRPPNPSKVPFWEFNIFLELFVNKIQVAVCFKTSVKLCKVYIYIAQRQSASFYISRIVGTTKLVNQNRRKSMIFPIILGSTIS